MRLQKVKTKPLDSGGRLQCASMETKKHVLYDNEQNTTIPSDPKEVPEITPCEVEAALRVMTNGTASGNDIETVKS